MHGPITLGIVSQDNSQPLVQLQFLLVVVRLLSPLHGVLASGGFFLSLRLLAVGSLEVEGGAQGKAEGQAQAQAHAQADGQAHGETEGRAQDSGRHLDAQDDDGGDVERIGVNVSGHGWQFRLPFASCGGLCNHSG